MPRHPSTPDCSIRNCPYAAYKGYLCRKHYKLVPAGMYQDCMAEVLTASHEAAKRHHKRQLAYVRKAIAGV